MEEGSEQFFTTDCKRLWSSNLHAVTVRTFCGHPAIAHAEVLREQTSSLSSLGSASRYLSVSAARIFKIQT